MLESEQPALVANCAALVDIAACEGDPGLALPRQRRRRWSNSPAGAGGTARGWSTSRPITTSPADGALSHDEDAPVVLMKPVRRDQIRGRGLCADFAGSAGCCGPASSGFAGGARRPSPNGRSTRSRPTRRSPCFADAFTSSIDVGTFARRPRSISQPGEASGLVNLAAREVYSKEAFIRALCRADGADADAGHHRPRSARSRPRVPESLGLDVARAEALLGRPLPTLKDVAEAVANAYRSSP